MCEMAEFSTGTGTGTSEWNKRSHCSNYVVKVFVYTVPVPLVTAILLCLVEIHGSRAVLPLRSTKNYVFFDFASVVTLTITRTLRIVLYS